MIALCGVMLGGFTLVAMAILELRAENNKKNIDRALKNGKPPI